MNNKIKGWITLSALTPTLFSCNAQLENKVRSPNKAKAEVWKIFPREAKADVYRCLNEKNSVNLQLTSLQNRDLCSNVVYKMGYIEVENDDDTSKNYKLANLKEQVKQIQKDNRQNTHYLSGPLI